MDINTIFIWIGNPKPHSRLAAGIFLFENQHAFFQKCLFSPKLVFLVIFVNRRGTHLHATKVAEIRPELPSRPNW